jgi:hypothetical protein
MRLRYLAAAPLVAVAMFGTTAAAWRSEGHNGPPSATVTVRWPGHWRACAPSTFFSSIRTGRALPPW